MCRDKQSRGSASLLVDPYSNPTFRFNLDPGFARLLIFNVDPNADLDPALYQSESDVNCDHWSTNPPGHHFEPQLLRCEPLKFLNFDVNADPDPAFSL
jgi:hypothetical protein